MSEEIVFSLRKYSVGLEVVVLSGTQDDLDSGVLESLNPLAASDWIELELSDSIDRFKTVQRLEFDDDEGSLLDDDAAECWPANSPFYGEGIESRMGAVPRFAFVSQGDKSWQVVQLRVGTRKVRFLRSIHDAYVATERYDCLRVLGEFAYHSEGPGPVSWDGGMALLDLGDYLIYTSDCDSSADDLAAFKSEDITDEILDWLDDCNGAFVYALGACEIKWSDKSKVDEYLDAISELHEFALVSLHLSSEEKERIFTRLVDENRAVRALTSWLADPTAEFADKLIAGVRQAIDDQSGSSLLYGNEIVEYFEGQSV